MRVLSLGRGILLAGLSVLGFVASQLRAAGPPLPDAEEVIRRFLEQARIAAAVEAGREVSYVRRTRVDELRSDGTVRESKTKEHAVTNRAGSVRAVLVRVDDREVRAEEKRNDRKDEAEARREVGRRRRGPDYVDEALVRRFDYVMEAVEEVEGRKAYRLGYVPKGSTVSGKDADRLLGMLHGHMWIDVEEYELVRVEARLREPLRLLGGFAGALQRLDFVISRRPVATGYWANVLLTARAEGRKLVSPFRASVRVEQDEFSVRPLNPATP